MADYKELVKALRIHTSADIECDECAYYDDCRIHGTGQEKMIADAAAAIEELQAEVERLEPKRGEIVRCGECKYWSEVDTSDGLRYGQCDRPGSAIRGNCFIRESWFCADGEREPSKE